MDWLAGIGVAFTPYAWAGHALMGVLIQCLIALPLRRGGIRNAWWIGAALSIGYWWSREKTEFEFHLKGLAHALSLGPYWYRGFLPLEWDSASQFQFYAPVAVNILLALWLNDARSGQRLQQPAKR